MRLLHLSDIHFRSPDCENPATDIHQPYRTLLAQDVVELCRAGGTVDAILVGGDIAQDAIANAQIGDRESLVKKQLADEEVGQALFKPLSAYNDFAKYFDCNIYPSRPFWTVDLHLKLTHLT